MRSTQFTALALLALSSSALASPTSLDTSPSPATLEVSTSSKSQQHGSTSSKLSDDLTSSESPDDSTKSKSKDDSTKSKSKDDSTKSKSKDDLTSYESPDGSPSSKSKHDSTKSKSSHDWTSSRSSHSSTKSKSSHGSTKSKSADGSAELKSLQGQPGNDCGRNISTISNKAGDKGRAHVLSQSQDAKFNFKTVKEYAKHDGADKGIYYLQMGGIGKGPQLKATLVDNVLQDKHGKQAYLLPGNKSHGHTSYPIVFADDKPKHGIDLPFFVHSSNRVEYPNLGDSFTLWTNYAPEVDAAGGGVVYVACPEDDEVSLLYLWVWKKFPKGDLPRLGKCTAVGLVLPDVTCENQQ